jgi:vancomycin resistance protein YoaR
MKFEGARLGSVVAMVAVVLAVLGGEITPARASTRSEGDTEDYRGASFATTLAEHTTELQFRGRHRGRAYNVALAASRLDGAIIGAGQEFSFNDRVGPRTRRAGFRAAPEINEGVLTDGVGGGVCQVATTLHHAVLGAGLEVLEQRTHTLPSHYARPGMDATVYYGQIDYRIRNPHPFPIRVRAHSEDGVLTVALEGAAPVAPTTVDVQVARRIPPQVRTVVDPSLPAGASVVEERGQAGVVAVVRIARPDGTRTERVVRYQATDRVVRVGAGS